MSKHVKYVPRHRDVPDHSGLLRGARSTVAYSGVAAVATGVSVAGGMLAAPGAISPALAAEKISTAAGGGTARADRTDTLSRSADRLAAVASTKRDALDDAGGVARTSVRQVDRNDYRALAQALMPEFGLSTSEFGCLDRIWTQESGWRVNADNPRSSAYGIPQALPGTRMAAAGPDWRTNPETQIRWGLGYIRDRYGSACGAWSFKAGHGWY